MSLFRKTGRRCDVCGKITRNKTREYTRPNGEAGYIMPDEEAGGDTCTDCVEAELASAELFVKEVAATE